MFFSLGCICHLAALCAAVGLKKLPLSIDNLLIDVYLNILLRDVLSSPWFSITSMKLHL